MMLFLRGVTQFDVFFQKFLRLTLGRLEHCEKFYWNTRVTWPSTWLYLFSSLFDSWHSYRFRTLVTEATIHVKDKSRSSFFPPNLQHFDDVAPANQFWRFYRLTAHRHVNSDMLIKKFIADSYEQVT